MLNGGGPGSLKHLKVPLEIRKKSQDYKFYLNIVTNVLKDHPIILEFFSHGRFIHQHKFVNVLTHGNKLIAVDQTHKLNLPVVYAAKNCMMTVFIEFLGTYHIKFIPLLVIHYGFVFASKTKLQQSDIDDINKRFCNLLNQYLGTGL